MPRFPDRLTLAPGSRLVRFAHLRALSEQPVDGEQPDAVYADPKGVERLRGEVVGNLPRRAEASAAKHRSSQSPCCSMGGAQVPRLGQFGPVLDMGAFGVRHGSLIAKARALSEVRVVFGAGAHRRSLHRVWGGEEADEPLPLVEIAAIGGLSPVETCHVLLHELAHVLAPGAGHGKAWRYAARQVGLREPRAWPDTSELSDWSAIAPDIRAKLQAIPEPTERAPADYSYDWHRQGCGVGYGTRGGTSRGEGSGSRYLKVVCQHPGCGYQVRVTRKWLALGTPQCPIADHGTMVPQDTRQASRKRRDLF